MEFTSSQKDAMNIRGKTLLVSAAAGSGKTFTLTQRIIKAITEEKQDISRLLVVTFTRSAAAELRAKISKALSEAIALDPSDLHLQAQMLKLSAAKISTIDSFFIEPVQANFEKLSLPASMKLADEAELSPIREAVMGEVLEKAFDESEGIYAGRLSSVGYRDKLTELSGIISSARNTSAILPTLLSIRNKLITTPEAQDKLLLHAERFKRQASLDFFESDEGKTVKSEIIATLKNTVAVFKRMAEQLKLEGIPEYVECFTEDADNCSQLLFLLENDTCSYVEAAKAFSEYKPGNIPRIKNEIRTEFSEKCKTLRSGKYNKEIKNIYGRYFVFTPEDISSSFSMSAELCLTLHSLLDKFEKKYSLEKLSRGLCEFSDMPRFMLRLLTNPDGSYSALADEMYERFDEVYIDEYQDVNEIQDRIFEIIGRDRRFMVGDIKQSIYAFREAEPSIFADYRRRFPIYKEGSLDKGVTVFMSENFRCDKSIVDLANLICSKIFISFKESIGYTAEDDLVFKKESPSDEYLSPKVIFNVVETPKKDECDGDENASDTEADTEDDTDEQYYDEAIITANEIARLIRDEKDSRGDPLTAGKIAVLVRGHAQAKPLISALSKLNISYTTTSKTEIFEDRRLRYLADLLSVIDNPRTDVPLSRVLSARIDNAEPFFELEELIKIRKSKDSSVSLFDAVISYSEIGEEKDIALRCSELLDIFSKLRRLSSGMAIDKFLRALTSMPRFSYLSQNEGFTYLYDCACKYVRRGWNGLYNFNKYLKLLIEKGESGSEASKASDAVTIMTIHQSKGLEFNTCFVFGMGKQFNMQDSKQSLIYSKDLCLSMKLPPDLSKSDGSITSLTSTRYRDTLMWYAGNLVTKTRQIEEEARIFYVALTRAKERLYLSGSLKKPFADKWQAAKDTLDLSYAVKKAGSYLDWVMLALSHSDYSDCCLRYIYQKGENKLTEPLSLHQGGSVGENATERETEFAALLSSPIGESYEEKLLSTIPAKVAASKATGDMLDHGIFIPIPTGKYFSEQDENGSEISKDTEEQIKNRIELMRSRPADFDSLLEINKKPTAAEIGTATHAFLQYCDYKYVTEHSLEEEISRLYEKKFISKRVADIIDRRSLEGFFKSRLFELIKDAKNVRREFKFRLFRPASDFTEDEKLSMLVKDKKIFVQGSIDLILETEDGDIILCDYKTDRLSAKEKKDPALLSEAMKQRHKDQMLQYRYAISKIFGKEPSKIYIYSTVAGAAVEI